MKARRLGVIGCGAAFERLYAPALKRVDAFSVCGAADPVAVPGGIARFGSAEDLVANAGVDCLLVLSPPALHEAHVALALRAGLPVLVEKPPALEPGACLGWNELVTPAFPRRYWPRYERRRDVREWRFVLETDPRTWGARHQAGALTDLLPHAVDLARWLSGSDITTTMVATALPRGARGEFGLESGATFAWEVRHGGGYAEQLEADGRAVRAPAGIATRLARRLGRSPTEDVAAVMAMLSDWNKRLAGGEAPRLATARDAVRCVEVLASVGDLLAGGR